MKMIVLTRTVRNDLDAQLWVRTWLVDRLAEAQAFARQQQDANPHYKYRLRYVNDDVAELLEEAYDDYVSDFEVC